MSESSMRSNLVKKMKPLDPQSIESPSTGIGIPDINFIGGWFECKWLRAAYQRRKIWAISRMKRI